MPITRAYGQASQLGNTPSASNPILNSAFQIWQRGTSFSETATDFYTADRWQVNGQTTGRTYSRQTTSDTTNLPNIQYCLRIQRTAGNATTTRSRVLQAFESVNSIPLAGKTITWSFYAKAGSNYSAASSALGYTLYSGTGTDENPRTGSYTGQTLPLNSTTAITTTWTRYSFSATLPTNCSEITPMFYVDWVGTAGANDFVEITGVQIDVGSVALPFRTYAATLAGELAACQRYFNNYGINTSGFALGQCYTTTVARFFMSFPEMRVAPTVSFSTAGDFALVNASGTYSNLTSFTSQGNTVNSITMDGTVASGLVAGNASWVRLNTGSGKYFYLSAEL